MSDFRQMRWTKNGRQLLTMTHQGVILDLENIVVGNGAWSDEQQSGEPPAALIGLRKTLPITKVEQEGEKATVYGMLTNVDLETGFAITEIGVTAKHPTHGEVLYMVDYVPLDRSSYMPDKTGAPVEIPIKLEIMVSPEQDVTLTIEDRFFSATKEDIGDHNEDPEAHDALFKRLATGTTAIISPADGATNIGETPIFTFLKFVPTLAGTEEQAIQLQIDLIENDFSNPVHDTGFLTTISEGYEQPSGFLEVLKVYKCRTRRRLNNGLISDWSEVSIFTTRDIFNYVLRAVNLEPVSGATNVGECPTFKCGPFAVAGDVADTHVGTQVRIRQGDTVIHLSPELGAVLKYKLPAGLHLVGNDYVFEFRHKGSLLGWGEWAVATPYRTAAAFITGDEAVYPSSWVGHDNASSAGVALADDAALRSNGIDQGEGEADWAEYSVRAKVRDAGLDIDTDKTTARSLTSFTKITDGDKFILGNDSEQGSFVAEKVIVNPYGDDVSCFYKYNDTLNDSILNYAAAELLGTATLSQSGVNTGTSGSVTAKIPDTVGSTFSHVTIGGRVKPRARGRLGWMITFVGVKNFPENDVIGLGNHGGKLFVCVRIHGIFLVNLYLSDLAPVVGEWTDLALSVDFANGSYTVEVNGVEHSGTFTAGAKTITEEYDIGICSYPAYAFGGEAKDLFLRRNSLDRSIPSQTYTADITSAALTAAPTDAHKLPVLTATTGPAGTAFTPVDFKEIPIEKAILGTDSDPDRPDFILLESTKQTPAESFRRVALGVSGLSKDSECRVTETQVNTWKQGA